MPLKHPGPATGRRQDLSVAPIFSLEAGTIPRHELPEGELPPDVAYQIVHDELMLDGNARLNLATFVTTWMEPQAEKLMAECVDKNMIDKDEYPQTAELEARCVNMLARPLARAGRRAEATGCSTTGSSEAAMLGGLALKRRWQQRRRADGQAGRHDRTSSWASTSRCAGRSSPTTGMSRRAWCRWKAIASTSRPTRRSQRCDENTIGVVAVLGSTFDGAYEPVAEICAALDALQAADAGSTSRCTSTARRADSIAPFLDPDLDWDFRLPRVASINTSGHKYGLVYPGVGWVVWRDARRAARASSSSG